MTFQNPGSFNYYCEIHGAPGHVGMAGAVAPLTTAILASVDNRHSGSASGLNSAVARSAGMFATALLGGVLGASGAALVTEFHLACVLCAGASAGAAACAFFLVKVDASKSPANQDL